jgi:beta-N-acetylhexosaminidase
LPPKAVIFGCAGEALTAEERRFFADTDPLGFILFLRNCREPGQVRDLVAALRNAVGRSDVPVLIDQEGGRVQRLKPPHWRQAPPAGRFGALYPADATAAVKATNINARLIAEDLRDLGIDVDCAPVLDVPSEDCHEVIGDRAFGSDPALVADLGRAYCDGLLSGGVLPVLKHIPGHGRASADSHHDLPAVDCSHAQLSGCDFVPFRRLRAMPLAMTGHVLYRELDPVAPATTSASTIADTIRGEIGFDGLLFSDDLSMRALSGTLGERASAAIAAGCDIALHCNGDMGEMEDVAAAVGPMSKAAQARLRRARAAVPARREIDRRSAEAKLAELLQD